MLNYPVPNRMADTAVILDITSKVKEILRSPVGQNFLEDFLFSSVGRELIKSLTNNKDSIKLAVRDEFNNEFDRACSTSHFRTLIQNVTNTESWRAQLLKHGIIVGTIADETGRIVSVEIDKQLHSAVRSEIRQQLNSIAEEVVNKHAQTIIPAVINNLAPTMLFNHSSQIVPQMVQRHIQDQFPHYLRDDPMAISAREDHVKIVSDSLFTVGGQILKQLVSDKGHAELVRLDVETTKQFYIDQLNEQLNTNSIRLDNQINQNNIHMNSRLGDFQNEYGSKFASLRSGFDRDLAKIQELAANNQLIQKNASSHLQNQQVINGELRGKIQRQDNMIWYLGMALGVASIGLAYLWFKIPTEITKTIIQSAPVIKLI